MGSIRDDLTIPLAAYLWQRIRQLGVQSVMGVPGDMNLELLDYIDGVEGLSWVGNANELNAAYAADGYSRVKGCPGVLVTTMGVGELSAINGVAGAFTENVKLIHIVGTTGTRAQKARAMIHHCLGPDPDHRVYSKISESVRAAHCWLDDVATAPAEVDRVIRECYVRSLPVYIFVPMDFVHVPILASLIDQPVDLNPRTDDEACTAAIHAVIDIIKTSSAPTIIVDALVHRYRATDVMNRLLDQLDLPTFTTPMGKSIVPEDKPYFGGVYNGQVSLPGVANAIETGSDLVIDVGFIHSDSNTGGHSRNPPRMAQSVLVAATYVQVGHARPSTPVPSPSSAAQSDAPYPSDLTSPRITQSWIWKRIGDMARPGDINNNGYTIERAIHGPEQGKLAYLPSIAPLQPPLLQTRHLTDRSYPRTGYNDIPLWNHQLLLRAFGARDGETNSRVVTTKQEFEQAISSPRYTDLGSIQLLEAIMDRMDVPWRLRAQIELINERNARMHVE
ncbi:thiamine diphosphate-binding protein [Aspergillus multicolor]|uniref:thiamine diphosphate-binding protein n=1 Tax=Aspergillus multicolor TaxID=41759 RepID=UPI003CCE304D